MPDSLYEHDALAWAEQQADLLRRLAAGERVNAPIDWANVIEEVEEVGRSALRACRSLLRQALIHLAKQHGWPESPAIAHWRDETVGFLTEARDNFTPSMRQSLDLARLYGDALYRLEQAAEPGPAPRPSPSNCPFTLDELLDERPDITTLVRRFDVQ